MSIILARGWDTFDTIQAVSTGGTFGVVTRNSLPVLQINPAAATGFARVNGFAADGSPTDLTATTLYIGFPFEVASAPTSQASACRVLTSAGLPLVRLLVNTDGTILLHYGNGSDVQTAIGSNVTISAGVHWVELGLVAIGTAGGATVELRVDGVVVSTASSLTVRSTNRAVAQVEIGTPFANTCNWYFGPVIGDDAAYPGPCATQVLVPNAAGNLAQWTGGTGSTFAEVDEVDGSHANDGDTTYIKTSAANNSDFNLSNTIGVLGPIKAVVGYMITRDEGGASLVQVKISQASANALTTQADPGSTYVYRAKIASVSPTTGVAWTQSEVDAARIEVESGAAVAIRVTAMGLFVIYRPDQTISPPEATATAQAEVPTIAATLPAVAATATTQAEVPALNATLAAVAATATAQAEVPTIIDQASIAPPEATATAQAETPTMTATWAAVEATATARGEVPVLNATLAAVEATATAQAEAPRIEAGAAFGIGPFIGSASKAMLSIGKATRSILARGTATAFRPARGSARIRRPGDLP